MSTVLQPHSTEDITENRLCHIRKPGTGESWCGLRVFTPATLHTWDECVTAHTQCVVCMGLRSNG